MTTETEAWLIANAASLIGSAITIFGFFLATKTVVWQLGKQHKSSLELQRRNSGEALGMKVHEILTTRVKSANEAIGIAISSAIMIVPNLKAYSWQKGLGLDPAAISARVPSLSALQSAVSNEKNFLIAEFESWSIVFPDIDVFRAALNAAHHDAAEAFQKLANELWAVLPMDMGDGSVHVPTRGNNLGDADLKRLGDLISNYTSALEELGSFVDDLSVESQNVLLSGIFERKVAPRKPGDPKRIVISTSPEDKAKLLLYFENETAWGRRSKEARTAIG